MAAPSLVASIAESDSLSDSSKAQYLEKLATLHRHVGKPLEWMVDNPAPVIATIQRRYPCVLTRRAFVAAIKAVFHHDPDLKVRKPTQFAAYTDFQNELSLAVTDRYMAAEPSDKERRNWVHWDDVLAKERELAATEYGSTRHLVLAMYCLIEPLRQDYGALRILIDRDPPHGATGNFLVLAKDASRGKLVLNSYKTAKKYGVYERELPPALLAIIKASLLAEPRAYLFVDKSGRPYRESNSFTQFSNRTLRALFGKRFTVSLMRHSHISNIDFNASTPGQLVEKCRNMAHSLTMQQLYRRKVEPEVSSRLSVVKQMDPPASEPASGVVVGQDGHRYVTLSI